MKLVLLLMPFLFLAAPGYAHMNGEPAMTPKPYQLNGVGLTQKLGNKIDLNLQFVNSQGKTVTLGSYFKPGVPVILSPVYFDCPNLCGLHLEGLTTVFRQLKLKLGSDFQAVAVSFNPKETPALAATKKQHYLTELGQPGAAKGWHFLTGQEAQIHQLTSELGFRYKWDPKTKMYLHVSAAVILTPDGKISRYLSGVYFDPTTLRLALVQASQGKLGNLIDAIYLYCCHFDPTKNKYVFVAMNVQRVGGLIVVLFLVCLIGGLIWSQKRKLKKEKS